MRTAKPWLVAACIVAAVIGAAVLLERVSSPTAVADEKPRGDYWRNHDGHWSMWHEADRRWYYTDGKHWFYHDGAAWKLYRFDKRFGHGFEHGGYKAPAPHVELVLPRHEVFIVR